MEKNKSLLLPGEVPNGTSPGLWRLSAVAHHLGLAPSTVVSAAEAGDLPFNIVRIGPRGLRFIRAAEVESFLAGDSA